MIQKVTLPKLGETVEVSTIERWLKQEGDAVAPGEVLCEITTDKATLEVESYYRGTLLRILAQPGTELPVGSVIAVVGDKGEAIPEDVLAAAPAGAPAAKGPRAAPAPAARAGPAAEPAAVRPGGRVVASPRARRRARELGLDLAAVAGSGPGGRVVEADLAAGPPAALKVRATPLARRAAEAGGADLAAIQGTGPGGKIVREDVRRAAGAPVAAPSAAPAAPPAPGRTLPLTPMRRIVAERMALSKRTIPCYYLEVEADVTDLAALRGTLKEKDPGAKITINDFVIKACGKALAAFSVVNSRWTDAGVERRAEANVGVAVALEEGLIVPVIRNADRKPLAEISREAADLADRARTKRLRPDECQGGCMTVTNLGMYGIQRFIAVVNPGESTILALGVAEDRVVVRQGGIQVRKVMAMTLSADHRLVDGAVGAQFLVAIGDALEAPKGLVD
jgi:pyruvate dehydrogenase E2 component (dihydrolipoamide acetyltransferase)